MTNPVLKPLLLAGALALVASPSHALLKIAANFDGAVFTCFDNQVGCDQDPTVGILQLPNNFTLNGVEIRGSAQIQAIATGPFTVNSLNTSSLQLINTTGINKPVTVAVGATDFQGPVVDYSATGGGTIQSLPANIGSTIELRFYGDTANQQGADTPNDTPGVLLASSGVLTQTLANQSFAFNPSGAFIDSDLFSLTLWSSGILRPHATLVGRSQSISLQMVPEPGSLLLLSSALVGLGALARMRRRTKTASAA